MRVFEHQKIQFSENGPFKEAHWKALSRYNELHRRTYFTTFHNGVSFSSYVGIIQVGRLNIEILPKIGKMVTPAEDKIIQWHNVLIEMLQTCRSTKVHRQGNANQHFTRNTSVLDIYLQVFLEEVASLLRKGLIKTYRKKLENLTTLKGKLNIQGQIRKNLVHKELFFVEHTVYDSINELNQVINEALKLVDKLHINPATRKKLAPLLLAFSEQPELSVVPERLNRLQTNGKNAYSYYEDALSIAKMLLLNYRPDPTHGGNNVIALLFNMNQLWEEYIYINLQSAARALQPPLMVRYHQSRHFWKKENINRSHRIITDIVVEQHNTVTIIDTKWKLPNSRLTPDADDLKQMFVYNHYWKSNHSILLYPGMLNQRHSGVYHKVHQDNTPDNICAVATCNILDEQNRLNRNIGQQILAAITQIPPPAQ